MKEINDTNQNSTDVITLEQAKNMKERPKGFLCKIKANRFALQFLQFTLKDPESGKIFHDMEFDEHKNEELLIDDDQYPQEMLDVFDEMRYIHYEFPISFLKAKVLSCTLKFKVGDLPVKNLILIENHYFKDQRIAHYEFKLPFCPPNTKNTAEYIYEVPELDEKIIQEISSKGLNTYSDTFFFVNGELIMHNKAEYSFTS